MDPEIKLLLQNLIKKNSLSFGVDEDSVWYTFKDKTSGNKVVFMCQHAFTTSDEIFANYFVTLDSVPIVRCTLPTLNAFKADAPKPDIVQLMEACAQKAIQQQNQIKKVQFLLIKEAAKAYS